MPPVPLLAFALLIAGCAATAPTPPADAEAALAAAERAWLDAYDTNDRAAMADALADGFTITFPDGTVQTRDDVIGGLAPAPTAAEGPTHYTEGRQIRVLGDTAILTGVYVGAGGETRMRYTDTWMWLDGRWHVVASHLSHAR
ncbi:nuclear transport factor 2 family protein [Rubrivirga sp. IMCC43871]|uniref:nuclear transport factor 2 family protein n=1 Tax=Rubrivirga sp. IMCC43871 TaxID=3391575 RepID=UPI00398FE9F1